MCIFCGLAPVEKTDEHVIPSWLIELTGPPTRNANFGVNWRQANLRRFSFNRFVFPACKTCNVRYSALEGETRTTFTKLLNRSHISAEDLAKLFDWFDKVRVGLWLGMRYLDKNFWNISPRFHIDQRIGRYDRMLAIYSDPHIDWRGISLPCTNTPIFTHMPSCFALRVNNMAFVNMSSAGLVSERIGFPFPSKEDGARKTEEGILIKINRGTGKINPPLLIERPPAGGTTLVQPMFRGFPTETDSLHDEEHVRKHSLDFIGGAGQIFINETAEPIKSPIIIPSTPLDWEGIRHYTLKMQRVRWVADDWMDPDSKERQEFSKQISEIQRTIERATFRQSRRIHPYRGPGR